MTIRCRKHETYELAILQNQRCGFNMYQHRRQGGLHFPLEHFEFRTQTAMPHDACTDRFRGERSRLDRAPAGWLKTIRILIGEMRFRGRHARPRTTCTM